MPEPPTSTQNTTEQKSVEGRGRTVSRLEGFSDAVFGFALTILVVSLDAPKSFHELERTVQGAPSFALCFAFLVLIWYKHYRFFREYGLEDPTTVVLNSVLLFTVLYYVYPLRLLFNLWAAFASNNHPEVASMIADAHQFIQLMVLFSAGYTSMMLIFSLLYMHAYRRRDDLELTAIEIAETRVSILTNLAFVAIGLASVLLALFLPLRALPLAWWIYALTAPIALILEPMLRRKARRRLD